MSTAFAKTEGTRFLAARIKVELKRRLKHIQDLQLFLSYSRDGIEKLKQLISADHSDRKKYIEIAKDTLVAFGVDLGIKSEQLNFAGNILKGGTYGNSPWNKPLEELLSEVVKSRDWVRYVDNLKTLSGYNHTSKVTAENVGDFFKEVEKYKTAGFENVQGLNVDDVKLRLLNYALRRSSKPVQYRPNKRTLVVMGQVIELASIDFKEAYVVDIFALEVVLIDAKVDLTGDRPQMTIIAPSVKVMKECNITLRGTDGLPHKIYKAGNGQFAGDRGEDGKPGRDGYDAGPFTLIAQTITDIKKLKVKSYGGDGGRGQNGGDGKLPETSQYLQNLSRTADPFLCSKFYDYIKSSEIQYEISDGDTFTFYGAKGGGGHGGMSGRPGKVGEVTIINLSSNEKVDVFLQNGHPGKDSKGGIPGKKGVLVTGRMIYSPVNMCQFIYTSSMKEWLLLAKPGLDNFIAGSPRPAGDVRKPLFSIVESYKTYLAKNFDNPSLSQKLKNFHKQLEEEPRIVDLYKADAFLEELLRLELEYRSKEGKLVLYPVYRSLSAYVEWYVKKRGQKDPDENERGMLSYVYAVARNKISSMQYEKENNLMMDVKWYLERAFKNVLVAKKAEEEALRRSDDAFFESEKISSLKAEIDNFEVAVENLKKDVEKRTTRLMQEFPDSSSLVIGNLRYLIVTLKSLIAFELGRVLFEYNHVLRMNLQSVVVRAVRVTQRFFFGFFFLFGSIFMTSTYLIVRVLNVRGLRPIADLAPTMVFLAQNKFNLSNLEQRATQLTGQNHSDPRCKLSNFPKVPQKSFNNYLDMVGMSHFRMAELYIFAHCIYCLLEPVFSGLYHNFIRISMQQSPTDSQLDMHLFTNKKLFDDILVFIDQFTTGLPSRMVYKFKTLVKDLEGYVETAGRMVRRALRSDEQMELAKFVGNVSLIGDVNVTYFGEKTRDTLNRLRETVATNFVLDQYEKAVSAFRNYVFPFAHFYLRHFGLPTGVNSTDVLASAAADQLKILHRKITEYDTSILRGQDPFVQKKIYARKYPNSRPFVSFPNSQYKAIIKRFLKGEEILFYNDIREGVEEDAVKFKTISLRMRVGTPCMQSELEKALQYYELRLLHHGRNYYRCGSKYFVINTESQNITASYARNEDGEPVFTNAVYKKLQKGNAVLSPYAYWTGKLVATFPLGYDNLRKFHEEISLEFEGEGQHIRKGSDACNEEFLSHYVETNEIKPKDKPKTQSQRSSASSGANRILPEFIQDFYRYFVGLMAPLLTSHGPCKSDSPCKGRRSISMGSCPSTSFTSFLLEEKFEDNVPMHANFGAVHFYEQTDSALRLAPVLLNLWTKNFRRRTRKTVTRC